MNFQRILQNQNVITSHQGKVWKYHKFGISQIWRWIKRDLIIIWRRFFIYIKFWMGDFLYTIPISNEFDNRWIHTDLKFLNSEFWRGEMRAVTSSKMLKLQSKRIPLCCNGPAFCGVVRVPPKRQSQAVMSSTSLLSQAVDISLWQRR